MTNMVFDFMDRFVLLFIEPSKAKGLNSRRDSFTDVIEALAERMIGLSHVVLYSAIFALIIIGLIKLYVLSAYLIVANGTAAYWYLLIPVAIVSAYILWSRRLMLRRLLAEEQELRHAGMLVDNSRYVELIKARRKASKGRLMEAMRSGVHKSSAQSAARKFQISIELLRQEIRSNYFLFDRYLIEFLDAAKAQEKEDGYQESASDDVYTYIEKSMLYAIVLKGLVEVYKRSDHRDEVLFLLPEITASIYSLGDLFYLYAGGTNGERNKRLSKVATDQIKLHHSVMKMLEMPEYEPEPYGA
ncbi:MAG: hypothetical protein AAGI37_08695 [Planctomycetota bacterium]